MAKALKEGDAAPAIQVEDDKGQPFSLASLKGKNVVLYFYPKADTPGCTQGILRVSRSLEEVHQGRHRDRRRVARQSGRAIQVQRQV